jgi:predicted metal-dependent phosphotriesterase family hydrolase
MTVLGPVAGDELGVTLPHEHLLLDLTRITRVADQILNDHALAVAEVGAFKRAGGSTVVELTNRGLGRDPAGLREIARQTGLNVVMGSGWYREPFYDTSLVKTYVDAIADQIVEDLTAGVDGSGIRAGIIGEIGSDLAWISPVEERVFRAAARAQRRTGAAISTHSVRCPGGLDHLDLFANEDVDPRRVIIGHCQSHPFFEYHLAVAKRGAYVQYDWTGRGNVAWEIESEVQWVLDLIRAGHHRQILLSHDICMKPHLKAYGGTGYDFVPTSFAERLRTAGLDDGEIRTILVDNPRTALTGV